MDVDGLKGWQGEMASVHVLGVGLDGLAGLSGVARQVVAQATVLMGSRRHLDYFIDFRGERLILEDLMGAIAAIQDRLGQGKTDIVVLASGDPLFFGLGRLVLATLPAHQVDFYPHVSSVQLAFSRICLPWQDARVVSVHGRSLEELVRLLQQGLEKIAVLTDGVNSPVAIANLLLALELPSQYQLWVCENLGGTDERVTSWTGTTIHQLARGASQDFSSLNVVVMVRLDGPADPCLDPATLPQLGLPDSLFFSFPDRPGLMTKREIRLLVLGELALQPEQVVWDVGAGTGSVAIEIARLCPGSQVYAVEKTAAGQTAIAKNCQRFQTHNVQVVGDAAPASLKGLPSPNRIFIGGSGGCLQVILDCCGQRLPVAGVMVLALATLEHLSLVLEWLRSQNQADDCDRKSWHYRLLQAQLARSVPVGPLTRLAPLNPVTLVIATKNRS